MLQISFHKIYLRFKPTLARFRLYYYHWGSLPAFLLLNFVKLLVGIVRLVTWRLNGVWYHLDAIYEGKNYELSAHILDVKLKCKASPLDKMRSCFFLATHKRFRHPRCVLAENVILAQITCQKAVFVELDRSIEECGVQNQPFLFMTLVKNAVRLIEMPISSLHKLADELPSPTDYFDSIIFLFSSGRCGSTAVARIVAEADLDDCLVISEPPVLMDFPRFRRLYSDDFYFPALRSSLKLLLRPIIAKRRLLVKPTYFVTNIADDVQTCLPDAKYLYCHRDPFDYVLAQQKAFGSSPLYKILQTILAFNLWDIGQMYVGYQRNARVEAALLKNLRSTLFEVCVVVWADNFWRYKEQAVKFHFPAVYYDDLLENPKTFCLALLQLVGLSNSRLPYALKGIQEDAQKGSCLSQEVLRDVPRPILDQATMERVDKFCEELSLPKFHWDMISGGDDDADRTVLSINGFKNSYQKAKNGSHPCRKEVRRLLDEWKPDNGTFCFRKVGRWSPLMHQDDAGNLVPFRRGEKI
uniref:Sulfotransferase n=1 Tax=Romanomermis culicivorax TaxID=13658 RepID=A0A915KMC3_ROMCU